MSKRPCGLRVRIDGSIEGNEVLFEEQLSPDFLDLPQGDELLPVTDIDVCGRAYRASDWIMVEGSVKAQLSLPCATCNERTVFSVEISPWELNLPVDLAKDGMLDLTEVLREAILLEVPFIVKCGGETCRNESEIRKYLAPEGRHQTDDGEERNQPFLSLL